MGKAEDTKNYIIRQAAPIFNMYGYAGTTMSQLTRAIKMTKGAIYGNFKDKDEIALAAFDHNFEQISEKVRRVVRSEKDACDKLIALANFYLDEFTEIARTGGCPILNAAVDSDDVYPALKERVKNAVEEWFSTVAHVVRNGITHHQIVSHTKPEQFASLFVSLIEGGIMLSKVTGNTIHLSRNIDHIIHVVNAQLRL